MNIAFSKSFAKAENVVAFQPQLSEEKISI
jgi:hypothetical protein